MEQNSSSMKWTTVVLAGAPLFFIILGLAYFAEGLKAIPEGLVAWGTIVLAFTTYLLGKAGREQADKSIGENRRIRDEEIAKESLRKAIKAGVKVAVGTDAPIIPHGKNAYEVTVMVDRGMTPAEALRSATIVPAELIRIDNLGQIKEGMLADLIAVGANPLDDIGTLENVSFVMKAGQVYKLEE